MLGTVLVLSVCAEAETCRKPLLPITDTATMTAMSKATQLVTIVPIRNLSSMGYFRMEQNHRCATMRLKSAQLGPRHKHLSPG